MRLVYKIVLTFLIPLVLTLGLWGWLSYRTMERKIHADTDMILKDYSEDIIMRKLSGKELPDRFNGAYTTYYLEQIPSEEAASRPPVTYGEAEAFLKSQEDFASSRIRTQIFEDNDGNFYRLTVSLPIFEQDVLIEHVLWWTVILFVVLLLTLLLIGLFVVDFNLRPLYAMLRWIDRYEPGRQNDPVPSDTDIREFRKLSSAVQKAVDRFEKQYEDRKIFIGNVSHELQTPLAACSNRLEMMLDRPDLDEEFASEIVKVHRDLRGLIRLNRTLLLLSRIENGQFPKSDIVNINALIHQLLEDNAEVYGHKNISLAVEETAELHIEIDPQMASVIVGNLIRNAYQYSPAGGTIGIEVTSQGFIISNDGDNPLERSKLFNRFYQPLGRREGSTGLGIALAYSVCVHNGLEISYDFIDSRHIFAVTSKNSK